MAAACLWAWGGVLAGPIEPSPATSEPARREAPEPRAGSRQAPDLSAPSARRLGKGRHSLRCWQDGKLIYEAAGVTPAGRVAAAAIELKSDQDVVLQVVDMRHGLCVLELPTAP